MYFEGILLGFVKMNLRIYFFSGKLYDIE